LRYKKDEDDFINSILNEEMEEFQAILIGQVIARFSTSFQLGLVTPVRGGFWILLNLNSHLFITSAPKPKSFPKVNLKA
jgi:hypothetical protein